MSMWTVSVTKQEMIYYYHQHHISISPHRVSLSGSCSACLSVWDSRWLRANKRTQFARTFVLYLQQNRIYELYFKRFSSRKQIILYFLHSFSYEKKKFNDITYHGWYTMDWLLYIGRTIICFIFLHAHSLVESHIYTVEYTQMHEPSPSMLIFVFCLFHCRLTNATSRWLRGSAFRFILISFILFFFDIFILYIYFCV